MRATWFGVLAVVIGLTGTAWATDETCGDGTDNNANAQTDEGCYPAAVTGVCESPLDCAVGGSVAPKLGTLVYPVLPDVTPTVPYGPGIPFQRTYTSQYAPGYPYPSASTYRTSLGYRWQHNYASWLEKFATPNPDEVVLHTVDGRDVLFRYSSNDGTYDLYTPQVGYHYQYLRQRTATGTGLYDWELRLLTGEIYGYDGSGLGSHVAKLVTIHDSTAAAANKVTITYNADGKIDQVQAANSGTITKYLQFDYVSTGTKLLQYVKYYADGTLRLTVEFTYSSDKLATAKLGSTTVESYSYDANGYLTGVTDGGSKTVAAFTYLSTVGGKVIRVHTGEGDVGYNYSDAGCTAGTETGVYYHRYDTNTCTADGAGGGADYYCGGKDAGGTGWRFKVRRCLTVTTPNEHLVTDVAAVTFVAGTSASCASCVGTKHYEYYTNSPTNDALELRGTLSADSIKTSTEINTNGLVKTRVENDDDYDATNASPAGARATYFTFDSTFPGRITEVRIKSELQGGTCDATTTTACKQTLYTYNTDGLMATSREKGWTYSVNATATPYDYTTTYAYDSSGRITQMAGPLSGSDNIDYTYWAASNGLSTDYLKEVKRRKDDNNYVMTTLDEYDFWGQPLQVKDPNSKLTCRTTDASYGRVSSSRVRIGGMQTNCTGSTSDDETTSYTYDTHRRVTKVTKPRGNCDAYTYDSLGRVSIHLQANYDGTSACQTAGDTLNYTYSDDGLVTKREWKDVFSTVTRRQEYTYQTNRRVLTVINPVDTSKAQTWSYDDDGVPAEVQWEDYSTSNARTAWDVDALNRTTALRRYTGTSSNEALTITPGVQLDLPTRVRDPLTHDLDLVWDDLGRKVKQLTAEGGTNLYLYDAAGNLTKVIQSYLGTNTSTTDYTYDYLHRVLTEDPGEAPCSGTGGAEIQYVYDALGGATCPTNSNCANLAGHLAYVKTQIYCDGNPTDARFDQVTYYSYTDGGRIAEHTVKDDAATPRVGRVVYTYNKNGKETRVDYPGGTSTGAVYEYGPFNYGDNDKIITMKRDTTTTADSIQWNPFGPVKQYRQMNAFIHGSAYVVMNAFTYNLAYRDTSIWARSQYSTPDEVFKIAYAEDARGRYTQRDLSYGSGSDRDMFFLYDNLNRTTCRSTTSQSSCPASGGAGQMETLAYNTSSDRTSLVLNNNVISSTTYTYNYVSSTSDRIDCISMDAKLCGGSNPSTTKIAFTWDSRGNRLTDDDSNYSGQSNDLRTYTYDGRNNLLTVIGKFYFAASTLHAYTTTYAYDERNRMIFKSFKDTTANPNVEAQWFFYYDQHDHVIEAKYTPNISTSGTYSVFQWYWLNELPILYYQLDYTSDTLGTTTRRFLQSDEQGRPHAAWSWPTTGDTARVWEVEAGAFGWDIPVVGATIYQPLRFPGQKYDADTEAVTLNGIAKKVLRAGLADDQGSTYDGFTGTAFSLGGHNPKDLGDVGPDESHSCQGGLGHGGHHPTTDEVLVGCCIADIIEDFCGNHLCQYSLEISLDDFCKIDCCPCLPWLEICEGWVPPESACGNGVCEGTEDCASCPADCPCPADCGNNICESGEHCLNCPQDCSICPVGEPKPPKPPGALPPQTPSTPQPCSNPYKPCADPENPFFHPPLDPKSI